MSAAQNQTQVFGHHDIIAALKRGFGSDGLHHALIFSGPEGVGKATCAWQFMRYALTYPQGQGDQDDFHVDPDHRAARLIASGGHPNIFTIYPLFDEKKQKYSRDINVGALEGLTEFLRLAPMDDGTRFVLIDPADAMNRFTQNALLKMLEEPPQRTIFILITSRPAVLLPTVRSRCLTIAFNGLGRKEFSAGLAALYPAQSKRADALFELTQGSLGRAAMLAENDLLTVYGEFCRAATAWQNNDSQSAMYFAELYQGNEDMLAELYRLLLDRLGLVVKHRLQNAAITAILPEEQALLKAWQRADIAGLLACYDRFQFLWTEGIQTYLDKKLILLKAIGLLSGMDSAKQPVLA